MKSIFSTLLFAYLLLSSHAIRVPHQHNLVSLHKAGLQTGGSGSDQVIAAAEACYSAFVSNIPPSFCWKKGADAGIIPTGCPSGWYRQAAECWKNCDSGYYNVAGVCWQSCPSGSTDIGVSCFRPPFNFQTKRSYITPRITNFDSQVPCPDGMYKGGALCYRDCAKIGLVNCGIGACATSGTVCGLSIAKIATDFAISLGQAVAFVASFGTSSAASPSVSAGRTAASKAFQTADKAALKAAATQALNAIKKIGTKEFVNKMVKKAAEQLAGKVSEKIISMACNDVGEKVFGKLADNNDKNADLKWQDFDPTGIANAVGDCKKDQSIENNRIACASSVLNTISIVDPTGVTGMASAFMHPSCDV